MGMCIHETKELEYQMEKQGRITSSILWKWFYQFDDKISELGARVTDKKTKLLLALSFVFAFGDTFTTQFFLKLGLAEEGNIIPARLFAAGLNWEFEVLKWLAVTFIFGFNYVMATRGWTQTERNGGRVGLLVSCSIFAGVVIWNLTTIIVNVFVG